MADKEFLVEAIKTALVDVLKTGSSAPKVYIRVRPDGTVDTSEETGWCCSPDEYYNRVPHTLSLEVVKGERDYSSLTDSEIEECADNASEAADETLEYWDRRIDEWIEAGNLIGSTADQSVSR